MNCITAHCLISDHIIRKNGKTLLEDKTMDLPGFLLFAYQQLGLNYPRFHKMDRLSRLGWLATEVLLAGEPGRNEDPSGNDPSGNDQSGKTNRRPEETGIVLTNANSSLDTDLKYFESAKYIPSPSLFVYTLPNIVIGEICIRNNIKGEGAFFVTGSFDAGFLTRYVDNLLDNGILQVCICGWVDVLEEEYKAALFRVEKRKAENAKAENENVGNENVGNENAEKCNPFTKENLDKLFLAENG